MFRNKALVVILVLCIVLTGTSINLTTFASTLKFSDVPDNAYYADGVYRLVDMGAIAGYGNGKFGPEDKMTRSQYVKVIIAATVGNQPKGENHILENYMVKAYQLGIITGEEFPLETWDNPISREDMAIVLVRTMDKVLKESLTEDTSPYTATIADFGDYSDKHKEYIGQAYSKGLLAGYTNGNYGGKDPMIRAQACATVIRLLDKSKRATPNKQISIAKWSDSEFDNLLNGLFHGTDDTLVDNIYNLGSGIYTRLENGLIYWDIDYDGVFELIPESVAPNINKTVYNAVKNLVYTAYINGGTVSLSTGGYSTGEKVAHISYRGRALTNKDKRDFNRPGVRMDYVGTGADWTLSIPFESHKTFEMYREFFEYDDAESKATQKRIADFQNSYTGKYKFHWTVSYIYGDKYYNDKLRNHVKGTFYNPIDGVHSEYFRQFVKDIYGTRDGEAMYKYIAKTITDFPNTPGYINMTHDSPSNTSFKVSTAVGVGLGRDYFYTE